MAAASPTARSPTRATPLATQTVHLQEATHAARPDYGDWEIQGNWGSAEPETQAVRLATINIRALDMDAQAAKRSGRYLAKEFKTVLGLGTQTHTSQYRGNQVTVRNGVPTPGGIVIVVGPKWGKSVTKFTDDPSGTGVACELLLQGANGLLQIIATYWPVKHTADKDNTTTLQGQLNQWLASTNQPQGPQKTNSCTIIAGDLNTTAKLLHKWSDEHDLWNAIEEDHLNTSSFYTRTGTSSAGTISKTNIDHILHSGSEHNIHYMRAGNSHGLAWAEAAGNVLLSLAKHSSMVVGHLLQNNLHKGNKAFKDGWSPQYMGMAYTYTIPPLDQRSKRADEQGHPATGILVASYN
eukprot:gene29000-35971_t